MCGLVGLFDPSHHASTEELSRICGDMNSRLAHRGPDSQGVWISPDAGLALGHRRLAVIDLSPLGHQPMASPSGRYCIAYNGEIYNSPSLREELERVGCAFRGSSDTEVLLGAVDAWGLDGTLGRLEGMFAFALWDAHERSLVLARDRFGEKPLYYAQLGDRLVFASELGALQRCPWTDWRIDRNSLGLLLRDLCVPEPAAIYQQTKKVPRGSYVAFRAGRVASAKPHTWWSAVDAARRSIARPFVGTFEDAVDATEEALARSVRMRCLADVPLGAFLSGGIDSSTVVALMQQRGGSRVRTFSVGVADSDLDEAPHARRVAEVLGTEHTELYTSEQEILAHATEIAGVYDEPFADSSQIPTFLVAKLARAHVTVALAGDGGDELFGGYGRYDAVPALWRRLARIPRPLRRAAPWLLEHLPSASWPILGRGGRRARSYANRFAGPVQAGARLRAIGSSTSLDELYGVMNMQWKAPHDVVLGAAEQPPSALRLLPPGRSAIEELMLRDTIDYLPNDLLVKVDRATMNVALESRLPFLDTRLFELAWSLPVEHRRAHGDGKRVLKAMLARHVPEHLFRRPKMGFSIPIGRWLKGPLRAWAESLLDERRLREDGYFDVPAVRSAWRRHLERDAAFTHEIWIVLQFQSWLDHRRASQPTGASA